MKVGYSRTSTTRQDYGLEDQNEKLNDFGCEKIFSEQVSSVSNNRTQFDQALDFVRSGDQLVVCKLDRLARSIRDLWNIIDLLEKKEVSLVVMDMNLDTSSATGRLMISLLGSISEFERSLLLERQRIGIEKAKSEGKFKGRQPTARNQNEKIVELHKKGLKPSEIAKELDVSTASVYRYRNG